MEPRFVGEVVCVGGEGVMKNSFRLRHGDEYFFVEDGWGMRWVVRLVFWFVL